MTSIHLLISFFEIQLRRLSYEKLKFVIFFCSVLCNQRCHRTSSHRSFIGCLCKYDLRSRLIKGRRFSANLLKASNNFSSTHSDNKLHLLLTRPSSFPLNFFCEFGGKRWRWNKSLFWELIISVLFVVLVFFVWKINMY